MNTYQSYFLGWQDSVNRRWYPVGRLDVDKTLPQFSFGYTKGAEEAVKKSGFTALYDFPEFGRIYKSNYLFPLFENRVMTSRRKSYQDYLRMLAIENQNPDPLDILSVDGGYRATDRFQVFPKIEKQPDGSFQCRFFLHGWRHTNECAQKRLESLEENENLFVTIELTNPATKLAVQIQTEDYHMIGWAPRYLVNDLVQAISYAPGDYHARVVRINPEPAPSKQRVLIELSGLWPQEHIPMSSPEFELIGSA